MARTASALRALATASALLAAGPALPFQTNDPNYVDPHYDRSRNIYTTYDWFDPNAPTVVVEDIADHRARMGDVSEKQRNEGLRQSQACLDKAKAPAARPAPQMPAEPAAAPVRDDLKGLSLEALARMYQETKDPAVEAAIRQRVYSDAVKQQRAAPAANPLPQFGQVPGVGKVAADQMRAASVAGDPEYQACLAAAERTGSQALPDKLENYTDVDEDLIKPLRDGQAKSLVLDTFGAWPLKGKIDPNTGEEAVGPAGRISRLNVVMRASPLARAAVAPSVAVHRTRRSDQTLWPDPPRDVLVRSDDMQSGRVSRPAVAGTGGSEKNRGSLGGIGSALERLRDKLKDAPK